MLGHRDNTRRRQQLILIGQILTLLLLVYLARFMLHSQFGFYEDDYTLVVRGMAAPWSEVWAVLMERVGGFARQGRPLQHSLVVALSYLMGRIGGRVPAYWLAYGILSANVVLFFHWMRQLGGSSFAWMASVGYALYSADTTQPFLYHAFGLQPGLTLIMAAGLAYARRRRVLAYLLGFGALMTYETTYFLLLAVPLLERPWDRAWRRRTLFHSLIVLAIFAVVSAGRALAGEGRVLALGWPGVITTPLTHMLIGPAVALGSYLLRPAQAWLGADGRLLGWSLAAVVGGVLMLLAWRRWVVRMGVELDSDPAPVPTTGSAGEGRLARWLAALEQNHSLRLLLAGVAMLVLAYPLTFTIRAQAISGRDTRVHLAAVIGAAMVWGCLWYGLLNRFRRGATGALAIALVATIWAGNLAFGLVVQRDYARAWDLQQRLWTSLVDQDLSWSPETTVFVDPAGLVDTTYIGANTWNMPLVLQYIYQFPSAWERRPQVYRLQAEWQQRSLSNPNEFKALDTRWEYVVTPWPNVVLFDTQDGRVSERLSQVRINGESHSLRPQGGQPSSSLPPGYLYDALIVDR